MLPTGFLAARPPNCEDPLNKSEENARLKVYKPASAREIRAAPEASWGSIWRPISLAVL